MNYTGHMIFGYTTNRKKMERKILKIAVPSCLVFGGPLNLTLNSCGCTAHMSMTICNIGQYTRLWDEHVLNLVVMFSEALPFSYIEAVFLVSGSLCHLVRNLSEFFF